MNSVFLQTILAVILLVVTILTGVMLKKVRAPYPRRLLGLHKIGITAALILIILVIIKHLNELSLNDLSKVLLILFGSFIIVAYITGALLPAEKKWHKGFTFLHKISSLLLLLIFAVIWILYH